MALDLRVRRMLRDLAQRFIDDVMAAIAAADPGGGEAGGARPVRRRVRRRAKKLDELGDAVLLALAQRGGVAVSEIARFIGSTPRELSRPIAVLLARGRIAKIGERKGTRYSLPKAVPERPAAPRKARERTAPRAKAVRKRGGKRRR